MFKLFRNFSCSARAREPRPREPEMRTNEVIIDFEAQLREHNAANKELVKWNIKAREEADRAALITESNWYIESKEEFINLLTTTIREEQKNIITEYVQINKLQWTQAEIDYASELLIKVNNSNRVPQKRKLGFDRINNEVVSTISILVRNEETTHAAMIYAASKGRGHNLRVSREFPLKLRQSNNFRTLRLFRATSATDLKTDIETWSVSSSAVVAPAIAAAARAATVDAMNAATAAAAAADAATFAQQEAKVAADALKSDMLSIGF